MNKEARVIKTLKELKKYNLITIQQFRTYKGQVLAGNVDACITGLVRKGLIVNG